MRLGILSGLFGPADQFGILLRVRGLGLLRGRRLLVLVVTARVPDLNDLAALPLGRFLRFGSIGGGLY